ncbi:MAG: glycosyltransferase family 4 protein [Anaerolineales bacterium]
MRILFVADGRSPTALGWIEYFTRSGHEVHLVSTFVCDPNLKLASQQVVPVAFSGAVKESRSGRGLRAGLPTGLRTTLRNWLGPLTIKTAANRLRQVIDEIKPDLVHAMRIPFEGMLAAAADPGIPLLISVWGNDFTLHARSNPLMAAATRKAMARADALHTDTKRDQQLAQGWGFAAGKPSIVLPGNGGVRADIFYPASHAPGDVRVINPRGIRSYVRNDTFFRASALVLEKMPDVHFDCPAMQGEPEAERWVKKLDLGERVHLLPKLTLPQLAEAYRRATVMASPSTHDGTPNSLLEAMACGLFPVCGDLASIREWIQDGENGLLVDPGDAQALATAIIKGLTDSELRERAASINAKQVSERADYERNMKAVETFYEQLVQDRHVSLRKAR